MMNRLVLLIVTLVSLLPSGAYAAVQASACADMNFRESGQDLVLEIDPQRTALGGSLSVTLSPEQTRALLRVEINDPNGGTQLSVIEAGETPEILHIQQVTHKAGELALLPVIEIYFEKAFVAVQLRQFDEKKRYVIGASAIGNGDYLIDCPNLAWSNVDFAPTKKMNLNLDEALAGLIAYKRAEVHQLNLDKAKLELDGEALSSALNESLEREAELETELGELSTQSLAQAKQCRATTQDLAEQAKKTKRSLRKAGESKGSSVFKAVRGIVKAIKQALQTQLNSI